MGEGRLVFFPCFLGLDVGFKAFCDGCWFLFVGCWVMAVECWEFSWIKFCFVFLIVLGCGMFLSWALVFL